MGCGFGRVLGMAEGISSTLFPSWLGVDSASFFGMICGAEQLLSSLHSQNFIRQHAFLKWIIGREKNQRFFEDCESNVFRSKSFLFLVLSWIGL
jgi:hypothetical protein